MIATKNTKEEKTMKTQETINAVRAWGIEKGITGPDGARNENAQFYKLIEEATELAKSIVVNDHDEKIDAIGDCTVVLILMADIIGETFEDCLESAYNVIKSRTGRIVEGAFIKDNQPTKGE
jgi:NTP pyrophosphatase (non-canonical NTP hydrolase)